MNFNLLPGANSSEPVREGAHMFGDDVIDTNNQGDWLTVAEAVVYCTFKGLPRTAKTIRRWARRSLLFPFLMKPRSLLKSRISKMVSVG